MSARVLKFLTPESESHKKIDSTYVVLVPMVTDNSSTIGSIIISLLMIVIIRCVCYTGKQAAIEGAPDKPA